MSPDEVALLHDIRKAIALIAQFSSGRTFEEY